MKLIELINQKGSMDVDLFDKDYEICYGVSLDASLPVYDSYDVFHKHFVENLDVINYSDEHSIDSIVVDVSKYIKENRDLLFDVLPPDLHKDLTDVEMEYAISFVLHMETGNMQMIKYDQFAENLKNKELNKIVETEVEL